MPKSLGQKGILSLAILYYKLLKSINRKKRTILNSDFQKINFVRFLYLRLDFYLNLFLLLIPKLSEKKMLNL